MQVSSLSSIAISPKLWSGHPSRLDQPALPVMNARAQPFVTNNTLRPDEHTKCSIATLRGVSKSQRPKPAPLSHPWGLILNPPGHLPES